MPKQHPPSENYEPPIIDEQQRRFLLVTGYLEQLCLPTMYNRELSQADYDLWHKLLAPYPLKALEYAFENWARNGRQFPKPANILELVAAWKLSNRSDFESCGQCESGWVRVFEGLTDGSRTVDPKVGAVKRCQCLKDYIKRKQEKAA